MSRPCDAGCGRPAEYVVDLDDVADQVYVCEAHLRELLSASNGL